MSSSPSPTSAFDRAAVSYDADFSDRPLGRYLRHRVWNRLDESFDTGARLLDFGCGTGEDALWLARRGARVAAVDLSGAMVQVAARKMAAAGLSQAVRLEHLDSTGAASRQKLHQLARQLGSDDGRFDGAYSNFGVLNCVADRIRLLRSLAEVIRPGGRLVLVLMGPLCLSEILLNLARGKPSVAVRRLRAGRQARVAPDAELAVWYPTPGRLCREAGSAFRRLGGEAIGLVVPPTDQAAGLERRPRALAYLVALDRALCRCPGASSLGDHYLLRLERR